MNASPKKLAASPGAPSAVVTPAKREKPAAGNVAMAEAASTSAPEPFFYAEDEKFLWLGDAVKLEQGVGEDYAEVRLSVDNARELLIHLMRREIAQDDLTKFRKPSKGDYATLRKWRALQTVRATGSVKHRLVAHEMTEASKRDDGNFFVELGKALALKKRPLEYDYKRVSEVPRFLVENWCGNPSQLGYETLFRLMNPVDTCPDGSAPLCDKSKLFYFLPPLAFMNEDIRARFCADSLGINRNDPEMRPRSIAKWVSRLGLKSARKPRITGLDKCTGSDGKLRIRLRVVT